MRDFASEALMWRTHSSAAKNNAYFNNPYSTSFLWRILPRRSTNGTHRANEKRSAVSTGE